MTRPVAPGERSFVETVAHLLHCEDRSAEAIYSALLVKEPLLVHIHPERQLGRLLQLDKYPVDDLLAYFSFRRQLMVNVLEGLSAEQWRRVVRHEKKKRKESVYWQARALALHEHEHLSDLETQINRMMQEV